MRALHLVAPYRLEARDIPEPHAAELTDRDVLVRVLAGGICGSDLPYFRGGLGMWSASGPDERPSGFPLHEIAGEVVASRHPDIAEGQQVVGWASGFDGMRDLVITTGDELIVYDPARWAPEQAILVQPIACVLYAVEQLESSGTVAGCSAAVIGQGAIGALFSHVLATRGAIVTGVDRVDRTGIADELGVREMVVQSAEEWARGMSDADAPEIVVEAVGHQLSTFTSAIAAVRTGGRIFYFGIPDDDVYPLPMQDFIRKNLTLRAGITLDRARMLAEGIDYLTARPELLATLLTDVVPIGDAQLAFERALTPQPGRLKTVLRW
jgi:L-iditol 2-dehydrogenase